MITPPSTALYWPLAAMFASLMAGSIIRIIALWHAQPALRHQRLASLRTWWLLAIAVSAGLLAGRFGICLLFALASCVGWFEITRLCAARRQDRIAVRAGYVLIVTTYLLIFGGSVAAFALFLPVSALFVLPVLLLTQGEPAGYTRSSGGLLWGLMFLGYGVAHDACLMILPASSTGPLGPAGWLLFLLVLTESNDIFQALIGRLFSAHRRHLITPVISPNKTWEGFVGGMLATIVLSLLLAPWLTTLTQQAGPLSLSASMQAGVAPVLVAVLIAVTGFFGDINISAIKRDVGVKDGSNFLPGMGGIIDRIDSLTLSAPGFVYFLSWWMA